MKGKRYTVGIPQTIPAFIWHFARRYKWACGSIFVLTMLRGAITVFWPYSAKMIIDAFVGFANGGDPIGRLAAHIWPVIAVYFSVYALSIAVNRAVKFLASIYMPELITSVKTGVLARVQSQSYSFFINHFAGNVVNKVNDLGNETRNLLKHLWHICEISVFIAVSFAAFASVRWQFTAACFAWGACYLGYCFARMRVWNRLSEESGEAGSVLTGRVIDSVSNYITVKSFAGEKPERALLMPFFLDRQRKSRKAALTMNIDYMFLSIFTLLFLYAPVFYMVFRFYAAGTIGVGDIIFVVTAVDYTQEKVVQLSDVMAEFSESLGVMRQAMWVVSSPIEIKDGPGAKALRVRRAGIEFRNVGFRYESRKDALFNDFSLSIKPGEKIGLVGHSGAGKSSIVHLLLRYFDVSSGALLIDGQDISKATQESLRRAIAFIPQDTSLFHRTIYDNILYGRPDAVRSEVLAAAKKAYAHELILATPRGYESLVGDRGIKLSVGQRQRIAIARAILKDAPILILDEATSALDSETELGIQKSLEALMKGRTTIAIAHRLSTLRNMDRIIVLDQGRIAEEGTHKSLLAKKGLYARLWAMQSNGFIGE